MFADNEVVMLVLGVGVVAFILAHRRNMKHIPSGRVFVLGFYLLLAGWIATVAEHAVLGTLMNYLEHAGYALGSLCVVVWCHRALRTPREQS